MHEDPDLEMLKRDAQRGIPAAAYNLGVWYLREGGENADPDAARKAFESAAEGGFAPAKSALGYIYLRGQGVSADPERAAELFSRSAEAGFSEARYRLGELRAAGLGTPRDLKAAREDFSLAAELGHPPAMAQFAYCLSRGLGGDADGKRAARWYERAAVAGDPRSQWRLGFGQEHGEMLPADTIGALSWYLRAAATGYGRASQDCERLKATLEPEQLEEAARRSRSRPEPAEEIGQITPIADAAGGIICWNPRIFRFQVIVDDEEINHLIHLARPILRPAMVLNRQTGKRVRDPARRSHNARLNGPLRDTVVCNIEDRLARHSLIPVENGEPITILKYEPGDEYRPHADYYDPRHPGSGTGLTQGGQRVATFLIYLNDVMAGGETAFPRIDISVAPEQGTGLLFFNCTPDGTPDPRTLHAGRPVEKGEKWLLSRWIRANTYISQSG
ncbi:MAG: SEL1-like repeat protein [Gammaproteobacteria bacterium]|nr:MAG: SEL1-like repeat protein [Gammaproteobacteria bacterium]